MGNLGLKTPTAALLAAFLVNLAADIPAELRLRIAWLPSFAIGGSPLG